MVSRVFSPDKEIPDLSGKVIFITGGTGGLGKESVIQLAKHNPAHIFFSGRNVKNAAEVVDEVKQQSPNVPATFLECDLASLASVQKSAKEFVSKSQRLDILMCNAGIMACPPGLTKDGYEIQFGTNHLGHALLTKLLLPVLLKTAQLPGADVRIILLTSFAYESAPAGGILFKDLKTVQDNFLVAGPWRRYGQSKLADLLYAAELARRYPQITALAIHPGTINTGLASNLNLFNKGVFYMKTWRTLVNSDEGVWNQLWAVSANKKDLINGAYYVPVGVNEALKTKDAKNEALAEELWTWTQKELEGY